MCILRFQFLCALLREQLLPLYFPEYAQGFKITYTDQACLLDIQDPQNKESQSFHYALVPRGVEAEKTVKIIFIKLDRKSTRLNSSHRHTSRMPSSA